MEINNSYLEMAEHYGCVVVPARMGAFGGKLCEACDDEPYDGMIFNDKIGMCIDAEIEARNSGKIDKAAKTVCFKAGGACVGGGWVYHLPDCSITRDRIARLTTRAWVEVRESPVITSESGGAKSYVARALGVETCRRLTSVRHARPDDMFRDLNVAHSGGRIYGALDRFSKQPAHPGDFFTTSTENQLNAIDLFKMLEVREGRGSTMFASQPEPNHWYPRISSGSYADSMLSCAVGHVRVLNIKGSNMRECAASLKAEANKGLLGLTTAPISQKVGTASRGGRTVFIGHQY